MLLIQLPQRFIFHLTSLKLLLQRQRTQYLKCGRAGSIGDDGVAAPSAAVHKKARTISATEEIQQDFAAGISF